MVQEVRSAYYEICSLFLNENYQRYVLYFKIVVVLEMSVL